MQKLISLLHEKGSIISEEYEETGTKIKAKVPQRELHQFIDFITGGTDEGLDH